MARRKTTTKRYDAAEYLGRAEDIAAYLEAALEDGDPRVIAAAVKAAVRALRAVG